MAVVKGADLTDRKVHGEGHRHRSQGPNSRRGVPRLGRAGRETSGEDQQDQALCFAERASQSVERTERFCECLVLEMGET